MMKNFQAMPTKQEEVLLLCRFFSKFSTSSSFLYGGPPSPSWYKKKFEMVKAQEPIVSGQQECPSKKNVISGNRELNIIECVGLSLFLSHL